MQRGRELLLIRRRPRFPVVGRRGIVVDLAQGNAVAAPAALEHAVVAVHEDALLIDDVNLVGVLVQIEEEHPAGENVGILIVLFQRRCLLARRHSWRAMAEIPEKFAVAGEFLDAVASLRTRIATRFLRDPP